MPLFRSEEPVEVDGPGDVPVRLKQPAHFSSFQLCGSGPAL